MPQPARAALHGPLRQLGPTTWPIPIPTTTVRWGEQTWEEMMIGWFGAVYVDEDLQASAEKAEAQSATQ